jgi:Abortive infection alpha
MAENEIQKAQEVTLLKSEMEAAAARVAERAMNTTLDGFSGLVGDVFGGWFGEGVKQWRTRRLITALAKTKEHLEKHGIAIENAKALPMGELYSIFEGASRTDDADLTDMWAALLSNAMNPQRDTFIDPSFVRVLQNLSGLDAKILQYYQDFRKEWELYRNGLTPIHEAISRSQNRDDPATQAKIAQAKNIDEEFRDISARLLDSIVEQFSQQNISYSISNLLRVGLIAIDDRPDFRGDNKLLVAKMNSLSDVIEIDDRSLQHELKYIQRRFDYAVEGGEGLFKVAETSRFHRNIKMPTYELTGYGKRFLTACK